MESKGSEDESEGPGVYSMFVANVKCQICYYKIALSNQVNFSALEVFPMPKCNYSFFYW